MSESEFESDFEWLEVVSDSDMELMFLLLNSEAAVLGAECMNGSEFALISLGKAMQSDAE